MHIFLYADHVPSFMRHLSTTQHRHDSKFTKKENILRDAETSGCKQLKVKKRACNFAVTHTLI